MDFQISESGDLVLEEQVSSSQLSIAFRISDNPGIEISFHILSEEANVENKGLKIQFETIKDSDLSQRVKVIRNIEEKIQLIRIALMTELGELVNKKELGSLLKLYKHKDIHDRNNLRFIQTTILDCISNILTEPTVRVIPQNGVGNLYFHNVAVYIYEEQVQIFKFYV